jgi:hypothetical protein
MVELHLSPPEMAKRFNTDAPIVWQWLGGKTRVPLWVERELRAALDKQAAA